MNNQAITILLVEDDDVDVESIKRGFRKRKIANPFIVARDGIEALEILNEGIPSPYLIFLDLKMPRMNGIEFLKEVRSSPSLKKSIIFVLTTSNDDRDRWATYEQNIAGYLLKSQAGEDFCNVVEMLDIYWRYVEFPPAIAPK